MVGGAPGGLNSNKNTKKVLTLWQKILKNSNKSDFKSKLATFDPKTYSLLFFAIFSQVFNTYFLYFRLFRFPGAPPTTGISTKNSFRRRADGGPRRWGSNFQKIQKFWKAPQIAAKAYFWTIFGPQAPKSSEESFSGAKTAKFGPDFFKKNEN